MLFGGVWVSCAGVEFVPVDAGAVLVRDAECLVRALRAVLPCLLVELLDLLVSERGGDQSAGRFGVFALLDSVLTPSIPPSQAHHCPRGKNERPTRLLPQGQTTVISTTKVHVVRHELDNAPFFFYTLATHVRFSVCCYLELWEVIMEMTMLYEPDAVMSQPAEMNAVWCCCCYFCCSCA